MLETSRIDEWLWGRLRADTALQAQVGTRVYNGVAPEGATYPLVVFQLLSGTDNRGVGTARVMVQALYLVRAIGVGSGAALRQAADRLDALLHGASGPIADAEVLACVREEAYQLQEVDAGTTYRHTGGIYRLWAQPAA